MKSSFGAAVVFLIFALSTTVVAQPDAPGASAQTPRATAVPAGGQSMDPLDKFEESFDKEDVEGAADAIEMAFSQGVQPSMLAQVFAFAIQKNPTIFVKTICVLYVRITCCPPRITIIQYLVQVLVVTYAQYGEVATVTIINVITKAFVEVYFSGDIAIQVILSAFNYANEYGVGPTFLTALAQNNCPIFQEVFSDTVASKSSGNPGLAAAVKTALAGC